MTDIPIARQNTDRELWSAEDRYAKVFVTQSGGIGINVGGHVIVQSPEDWISRPQAPTEKREDISPTDGAAPSIRDTAPQGQAPLRHAVINLLADGFTNCLHKLLVFAGRAKI